MKTTGRPWVLLVMVLWSVGFLVGTTTHTIDLLLGGLNVYSGFPTPVRLFWVALTVLDPLVVVLLWLRLRSAIALGVVIMASDVSVNVTIFALSGSLTTFGIVSQAIFGCFVAVTAPWIWSSLRSSRDTHPPRSVA